MANLAFYNVSYSRAESSNQLLIKGEVENKSGRNLAAVAIRVVLFNKNVPIVSTVIVVNGLPNGRTKSFDKRVEELEYDKIVNSITRHEIYAESAY